VDKSKYLFVFIHSFATACSILSYYSSKSPIVEGTRSISLFFFSFLKRSLIFTVFCCPIYIRSRVEGEHPSGAAIDVGRQGDFDHLLVGWPNVVNHNDQVYRMYYSTYDAPRQVSAVFREWMECVHDGTIIRGGKGWHYLLLWNTQEIPALYCNALFLLMHSTFWPSSLYKPNNCRAFALWHPLFCCAALILGWMRYFSIVLCLVSCVSI